VDHQRVGKHRVRLLGTPALAGSAHCRDGAYVRVYISVARTMVSNDEPASTFSDFFRAQYSSLVGQAFILVGDLQEAQELTQETLLRAWRHWDDHPPMDDPSKWCRVVLHRLAIGTWRRRATAKRWLPKLGERAQAPLIAIEHIEVAEAARSLPPQQRRALVLHAVVGMSVEEIAAEMVVPESTVRTWISRARQKMSVLLEISDKDGD
jgi:RNA polymerase sigma-70 factor, ECF subfamily